MILYHTTNGDSVPSILREGLRGDAADPVHLSEHDTSDFIYALFDLEPGGFYEHEVGHHDVAVLFEVDVTGLELDGPYREAYGADNDEHHMYDATIPPERLRIASVYRGE